MATHCSAVSSATPWLRRGSGTALYAGAKHCARTTHDATSSRSQLSQRCFSSHSPLRVEFLKAMGDASHNKAAHDFSKTQQTGRCMAQYPAQGDHNPKHTVCLVCAVCSMIRNIWITVTLITYGCLPCRCLKVSIRVTCLTMSPHLFSRLAHSQPCPFPVLWHHLPFDPCTNGQRVCIPPGKQEQVAA